MQSNIYMVDLRPPHEIKVSKNGTKIVYKCLKCDYEKHIENGETKIINQGDQSLPHIIKTAG